LPVATVLPIALIVEGSRCLVVGAGRSGLRKVLDLRDAGATVHVVAPHVDAELRSLAEHDGRISLSRRSYESSDLDGTRLVVAATSDPVVNQRVYDDATSRGLLVNCVDDPDRCSFYFTALVRRDPVVVSVSTTGRSPALASYLRTQLDATLHPTLGLVAERLGELRDELHANGRSTTSIDWDAIVTAALLEVVATGATDEESPLLGTADRTVDVAT
jgi:siroheme synthase-like protein